MLQISYNVNVFQVMTLERILLQTIKFDFIVEHPYTYLLKYAKCLKGEFSLLCCPSQVLPHAPPPPPFFPLFLPFLTALALMLSPFLPSHPPPYSHPLPFFYHAITLPSLYHMTIAIHLLYQYPVMMSSLHLSATEHNGIK